MKNCASKWMIHNGANSYDKTRFIYFVPIRSINCRSKHYFKRKIVFFVKDKETMLTTKALLEITYLFQWLFTPITFVLLPYKIYAYELFILRPFSQNSIAKLISADNNLVRFH